MTEYNKTQLISQIGILKELLLTPQHRDSFLQSGDDVEELRKLFSHLEPYKDKWGDELLCNHDENPDELIKKWNELFDKDPEADESKEETNVLYSRTLKFLRSLKTIPYKRHISAKSIAVALERASDEQENIIAQLEMEKTKPQPDPIIIQNLEKLKTISADEVESLHKEKKQQELEEASEKDWQERIKDSFEVLHKCSIDMESERKKVDTEYHLFLYGLILPSIILLIWLCNLYGFIISQKEFFNNWMSFLPYYLPVPIFVAVFWIFIVQKNRAGKLSIALSERLYQIKYLEGLLMAINRLSPSSQDAISRINSSLDVIVNTYVHRITRESIDEKRVEELENKELSQDTYFNIIEKLTDIVKK